MDNLIALSLVYNRVFMFGDRKDDPVKIPQGKDPYISARTLSQFYYDASADNAVLIMPASEPWLSRYTRTQKAAEQKIKVQRVINPGCAAALTDLYRHRREGLVLAVVQWDRTLEAVLLDTLDGVVSVCSVYTDTAADNIALPRTLEKLLAEAGKNPEELARILLVEDARKQDSAVLLQLRNLAGKDADFMEYTLQDILEGAYHYGKSLMGKEDFVILLDALPGSFGVQTAEGFRPILTRNTNYPCNRELWVYPQSDDQTTMEISIQEESCTGTLSRIGIYRVDLPASGSAEDRKVCVTLDVNPSFHISLRVRDARNNSIIVKQGQEGAHPLPAAEPPVKEPFSPEARNAVLEFLPAYDNLLLAIDHPSKDPAYLKGISQTLKQMEEVFGRFGVEFYGAPGDSFDPRIHEAVIHISSDVFGRNQVIRVLKKGVRVDGKILRFAMVQVAN